MSQTSRPQHQSIAESSTKSINASQVYTIVTLLMLCWVSYFFNLEVTLGIPKLFLIVLFGFIININLPLKYRPVLIFLLCIIASTLVLNPLNVLILYALGAMIFVVTDIVVTKRLKISLLLLLAIVLTYIRSQFNFDFIQSRMWVILASIFIFRTIIFFKQKEEMESEVSLLKRFNYFFLFPNVFAPLFPIVDYSDYTKAVSTQEEADLHLDGINLVSLGVIQLIIYRLLYTYLLPSVGEISDVKSLIIYIVINYLLVYRLMGMLNISVGVLRMFGFNLPEIFNNIFIATSVSDFFRRLNIYWKEFLLKYFYYPIYFKYRKSGMFKALGISAVITFIFNWFFHAYQWFWILGTSPIRWTDTIFWSAFSIVAIAEMLYQAKNKVKKGNETIELFVWPLKVFVTFAFISIIWSLWTSPSIAFWLQTITNGFSSEGQSYLHIIGSLALVYIFGLIYKKILHERVESIFNTKRYLYRNINMILLSAISLIALLACTNVITEDFNSVISSFSKGEKNSDDKSKEAEGYYDGILEFNIGSANWDSALEVESIERTPVNKLKEIQIHYDDLRSYDFTPNGKVWKNGYLFESNNLGLRDRDYSEVPNKGVTRIAFVGGSPEAGLSMSNSKILEQIVEDSLNLLSTTSNKKFEILNYARNGFSAPHYRKWMESNLDVSHASHLMFVVRTRDFHWAYKKLYKSVIDEDKKMGSELSEFLKKRGIEFYSPMDKKIQRQYGELIWKWSYNEIQAMCLDNNLKPILLYIPELNRNSEKTSDYESIKMFCEDNNLDFIDLSGVYDGVDLKSINVSNALTGNHPNAKGHAVIAKKLFNEMVKYFSIDQ